MFLFDVHRVSSLPARHMRQWLGEAPEVAPGSPPWPWFLKETDRNWGTSTSVALVCARVAAKAYCAFQVQRSVWRKRRTMRPTWCRSTFLTPCCTTMGRSVTSSCLAIQALWHLPCRFYNLLVGLDDGVTWRLYTYKDGYLSISPKPWSPEDLPLGARGVRDVAEVEGMSGDHHPNQTDQ